MKFFKLFNIGMCLTGCIFFVSQASASKIQMDLTGTITNTYIWDVIDGNAAQEDANLWDINNGLPLDSNLNFRITYNTSTPSVSSDSTGNFDAYNLANLSVGGPFFNVHSADARMSIGNNQNSGWDFISTGFMSPAGTGLALNFQNEIYYLVAASLMIIDESGTALNNSSLPTYQSQLDAFWLSNSEPAAYWDHLARFDLQFVKDPLANSYANGSWPNGQALYVVGYFDDAKLTHVSEPSGLFLVLIGIVSFVMRKAWQK